VTNRAEILVAAGQHSFTGSVETRGLRILDVLIDPNSQFLKLHDVAIHRRFEAKPIRKISETLFRKTNIDFVLLKAQHHEAPMRRAHAMVAKRRHSALIVLDHCEIRGAYMSKGVIDPMQVLHEDSPQFFAVVSPNVYQGADDKMVFANAALINKAKVVLFHYEAQTASRSLVGIR